MAKTVDKSILEKIERQEEMPTRSLGQALEEIREEIANRWRQIELNGGDWTADQTRKSNFWLESEPGVGKTTSIQSLKEPKDIVLKDGRKYHWPGCEVKCIDCSTVLPGQLSGILSASKQDPSKAVRLLVEGTLPAPPKTPEQKKDPNFPYNKPGILFFDEITSLNWEARSELLTICCGSKLGITDNEGNEIPSLCPPNWICIAAGNITGTFQEGNGDWAVNVLDRFRRMKVTPSYDEWREWAENTEIKTYKKRGLHPQVLAFLNENEQYLCIPRTKAMITRKLVVPNPRRWEEVSSWLYNRDDRLESGFFIPQSEDNSFSALNEIIGPVIVAEFKTFIDFEKDMVPIKDMISTDLSKNEAKYKKYLGVDKSAKLLSIYNAIGACSDEALAKNKTALTNAYTNVLNNSEWLITSTAGSSRDLISSLVTRVKMAYPEFKVTGLSSTLQKAFIASKQFTS